MPSLMKADKAAVLYARMTELQASRPDLFRGGESGIADMNAHGGIRRGGYYIWAGPHKIGKTAALLTCFDRRVRSGDTGIYFTREMTNLQMQARWFAHNSRVNLTKLRDYNLTPSDIAELWRVVDIARNLEAFWYHGDGNLLVCLKIIEDIKPDFVVFDYAQLFWMPKARKGYENLTAVSALFRDITLPLTPLDDLTIDEIMSLTVDEIVSIEKHLPALMTAAQMNRAGKHKKANISEVDIAGTSAFENDADMFLIIKGVLDVAEQPVPNRRHILIPPGRFTEGGEFDVYFSGAHSKMISLTDDPINTVNIDDDDLFG